MVCLIPCQCRIYRRHLAHSQSHATRVLFRIRLRPSKARIVTSSCCCRDLYRRYKLQCKQRRRAQGWRSCIRTFRGSIRYPLRISPHLHLRLKTLVVTQSLHSHLSSSCHPPSQISPSLLLPPSAPLPQFVPPVCLKNNSCSTSFRCRKSRDYRNKIRNELLFIFKSIF